MDVCCMEHSNWDWDSKEHSNWDWDSKKWMQCES